MTDLLQEICHKTRQHVAALKSATPLAGMDKRAQAAPPPRGFILSLQNAVAKTGTGLIAEIKKASPSAGLMRAEFDPASIAQTYERAGAACLSVLTDAPYFQGSPDYLMAARAATTLPVLRKDFMVDVWQVAEARAMGADCILIIMAAVDDVMARDLYQSATHYGMDVLVEVHDGTELDRALKLPGGLLGINNRNLTTLVVDLAMTEQLAPRIPAGRMLVSESGVKNNSDIARMKKCGANCFLVGESLLKQSDLYAATRALIGN